MNFLSRSSLATGPNTRVPFISPLASRSTQALSSKRMYEPSGRRTSFTVRTTTAVDTAPFLTFPFGVASLTETTILSPNEAYLRFVPPKTRMVNTSFAPVLSATFNLDSCCTIIT